MKLLKSQIILLSAMLSACSLCSCSDDPQSPAEVIAAQDVPAAIHDDFTRSYPQASEVEWTVADGYAVVSFSAGNGAGHSSVWYWLHDNGKKMQCSPTSFEDLPAAVKNAFLESEYAALTPCGPVRIITRYIGGDVDYIYILKAKGALEGTASSAVTLYYTGDGVLVKMSSEIVYDSSFIDNEENDDYKEWLPQDVSDSINAYLAANYPNARLLYIDSHEGLTKVKILDGRTVRSLLFEAGGRWLSTSTEVNSRELPAEILEAFRSSEFADWHIHEISEHITAEGSHYYLLSLEKDKNKTELRIDADGTLPGESEEPAGSGDPDGSTYLTKDGIAAFISARYPGATVTKYEYDDDDAEVEITYDNHKIKVEFDRHAQGYLWKESEWEFDVRDASSLPSPLSQTISTVYGAYRLTYVVYHESPESAPYYEVGLKSVQSKETIKVRIDGNGNVMAEYGRH